MSKKALALILSLVMLFGLLAACGGQEAPASQDGGNEAADGGNDAAAGNDSGSDTGTDDGQTFKVGFSQGTMNHPFRVAMVEENVAYAAEHYPNMEIIVTDGNNESSKQVSDVEDLLAQDIDLLIISPLTSDALTDVCQQALDKGIPVVTLDRNVETEVTCFVGAENYPMGVQSAQLLAEMTDGTAKIIEIGGTAGASATVDRHDGFNNEIDANFPNMEVVSVYYADYLREPAMTYMEDMLQRFGPGEIDAVYCHNDEMALGALEAIKAAGRDDEGIILIGMDGTEVAFDAIATGDMAFSVVYPYCAPEGVQIAWQILNGEDVPARYQLDTAIVSASNIAEWAGRGL